MDMAIKFLSWLWREIKKYKIASSVVIAFALVFLIVSILIGMPPIGYIVLTTFIAGPTLLYVYKNKDKPESNSLLFLLSHISTL